MNNEERENELFERIFELEAEVQESNDSVTWWINRFNAVERYNRELKDILKEIDLKFYRCRFVGFNSNKDELKFLYNIINEVRQLTRKGSDKD